MGMKVVYFEYHHKDGDVDNGEFKNVSVLPLDKAETTKLNSNGYWEHTLDSSRSNIPGTWVRMVWLDIDKMSRSPKMGLQYVAEFIRQWDNRQFVDKLIDYRDAK